jgi:hypothetical protein
LCKAGDGFNLSFESLTSREALQLLWKIQTGEPELWEKISCIHLPGGDDEAAIGEEPAYPEVDEDDSCIPVNDILSHTESGGVVCNGIALNDNNQLVPSTESECYEVEDIEGSEELPDYGRGKRQQVENRQYREFWQH